MIMANNLCLYKKCGEYLGTYVNQVTGEFCGIGLPMDSNCLYVPQAARTDFSILYAHYLPTVSKNLPLYNLPLP